MTKWGRCGTYKEKATNETDERLQYALDKEAKIKDSGDRTEFSTGAVRDMHEGKGRYDLLPWVALQEIAKHMENGATKYGDRNWELGQPLSRYLDSAIRHAYAFLGGSREEDHMGAVAWNAMAYIETENRIEKGILPAELDDIKVVREVMAGEVSPTALIKGKDNETSQK